MWWMAASAGLNALSAINQYGADKAKAKAQQAWQDYSNRMVDLSATVSQNAITTNELLSADAFTNQAMQIQRGGMLAEAQAKVSAAAAGVKGNSVNRGVTHVLANAASREAERQEQFRVAQLGFTQQRTQVAMSAAMQKDYSYIPKPQAASYFLSAASSFASQGSNLKAMGML